VVIVDENGRIRGFQEKPDPAEALSNLGSCGIYVFEPEIFDYFPEQEFVDWAQDVFPVLLERDVPLYGHQISDYWDDVGSVKELLRGNFDALQGQVRVELEGTEIVGGLWLGDCTTLEGQVLMEPPVYIGEDCTMGSEAHLTGPVLIGDGCTIGERAMLRDTLVWPGTDVPAGAVLVGGLAGSRPLAKGLFRP
jgi:mannose-1-phosphate guanylyltransferase